MAPPANRRPGFSRRAQYGVFIGYVVAVAGLLFAVLLLLIAAIDPRGFAALKGAALDATSPVASGGAAVGRTAGGLFGSIGDYWRAGSQNAALRTELQDAQRRLVEAEAIRFENERLQRMLGLVRETNDEVTLARIVGSSFDSARRTATLSAGSSAGIEVGQPVRGPDGLIGRVLETGRWASRVLLVTDGASSVPVRLVRDGTPALAVGRGDGTIELRTLEVGTNPFRPGDILVTSGMGGLFPPNIPVARVLRLDGDSALARPLAEPGRLDFAMVLRAFQPAADRPIAEAPERPQPTPPQPGPPEADAPAPAAGPAQQNPLYQPGLQRPQPGLVTQPRPAPAPPAPGGAPPQ